MSPIVLEKEKTSLQARLKEREAQQEETLISEVPDSENPLPLKGLKDMSREELATVAESLGYTRETPSGKKRIDWEGLFEAILVAKKVLKRESKTDQRGRGLGYSLSVGRNGKIQIGAGYTQKMGLKPGDELKIQLGYKKIQLIKMEEEGEDEDEDENDADSNPQTEVEPETETETEE